VDDLITDAALRRHSTCRPARQRSASHHTRRCRTFPADRLGGGGRRSERQGFGPNGLVAGFTRQRSSFGRNGRCSAHQSARVKTSSTPTRGSHRDAKESPGRTPRGQRGATNDRDGSNHRPRQAGENRQPVGLQMRPNKSLEDLCNSVSSLRLSCSWH
jgi:hypothetical protein